jgi:hypothetical protein
MIDKNTPVGTLCRVITKYSHDFEVGTEVELMKRNSDGWFCCEARNGEGRNVRPEDLELAETVPASIEYSTTSPLLGLFSKERLLNQEVKLETFDDEDFYPF